MGDGSEPRSGVLLTVAYDGERFSGYARQKNGRTIAGELDGAVRALDASASLVRGTSRTDAGVHALAHPVAFDTRLTIPSRGWALALAAHLPDEISVVRAARVPPDFDPRRHTVKKTYRYVLHESKVRDPFWSGRAWRVGDWLNHDLLRAEAALLVGTHDFRAFRTAQDQRTETVRTLFRADLVHDAERRVSYVEIEGDRFMHRMVRIIVGTLVDVGRGRLAPGAVSRGLEHCERAYLGLTAPPDGLYLVKVDLDDTGEDHWP